MGEIQKEKEIPVLSSGSPQSEGKHMIQTDKVLRVDQGHPERRGQQCWLAERGWEGRTVYHREHAGGCDVLG